MNAPAAPPLALARALDESLVATLEQRSAIWVTGKDKTTWLNGLLTCDLAKRAEGAAAYGLLVEKKGRIQTDLLVLPTQPSDPPAEDALVLAVPTELRDATLTSLDHYLIMEDVELTARDDLAFWLAFGPRAGTLASLGPAAGTQHLFPGVEGIAIAAAAVAGDRVRAVVSAEGGRVLEPAEWDALRIEIGLPRFGAEVDASMYPQEASLEQVAVSFTKGCYLGQEVVYMLQMRGHAKQRLVALDVSGEGGVAVGASVVDASDAEVGKVRSAAIGPQRGKPVAIAMVKWAASAEGTKLRVDGRDAVVRACGRV